MVNYLLLLLGAVAFGAYKYSKAISRADFIFKVFLKKNIPVLVINICIGIAAILTNFIYSVTVNGAELEGFWWFCIGAFGQFIWRKLYKVFEKDSKVI